ncbi:MAG: ComF family protein [Romboutsia sp.]|nr:ComF family protein [Romboutsia sp.]
MSINPSIICGNWDIGYSLDRHTLFSVYCGEDEYGHPIFDTTRSDLGELMYQLKYHQDISIIDEIMNLISPFLDKFSKKYSINAIIPVPPSNTNRTFQPVSILAEYIGNYLGKKVFYDFISKTNNTQLKGLDSEAKRKAIKGSIAKHQHFISNNVNVLIVDDLYQTGSTLNEIVDVLRTDPNINEIYVLTITRTRR